jgi:hypothetical protein
MNAPTNSNSPRSTHSRIPSNLNNFHTLQNAPSHNYLIPDNLFTLRKNIGVRPPKLRTSGETQLKKSGNMPLPSLVLLSKLPVHAIGLL